MNSYIESLPYKLEQLKDSPDTKVVLVLGNESCDLDSAVCALVLAHHQSCFSGTFALPILNIPKEDVILKVLTCKNGTQFWPHSLNLGLFGGEQIDSHGSHCPVYESQYSVLNSHFF